MAIEFSKEGLGTFLYIGPFEWNGVHDHIIEFFEGWDFFENVYKHKKGGSGVEKEIEWKFVKKYTEFVKYEAEVKFRIWDWKDMEVVRDGKKKKMDHGRVEMKINWKVILDWQNRFDKSPFYRRLLTLYVKLNKWKLTEEYEEPMNVRILKLHEETKSLFGGTAYNVGGYHGE